MVDCFFAQVVIYFKRGKIYIRLPFVETYFYTRIYENFQSQQVWIVKKKDVICLLAVSYT